MIVFVLGVQHLSSFAQRFSAALVWFMCGRLVIFSSNFSLLLHENPLSLSLHTWISMNHNAIIEYQQRAESRKCENWSKSKTSTSVYEMEN